MRTRLYETFVLNEIFLLVQNICNTTLEAEENARTIDVIEIDMDVEASFPVIKLCKFAHNEVYEVYV